MLKVAMLALSASLTVSAIAPEQAAAQSGRQRAETRGGVVVPERRNDRVDERVIRDGRCYDERYDDRRWDDDDRRDGKHGRKKSKHDRRDRYNCDDDDRDSDSDSDSDSDRKSKGPKFCRNGQGHPVHGMSWCREKGWGTGSLRNVRWEDVILRRPRADVRRDLGRSVLQDILGRTVYGRFDQQRSRLGLGSALTGRWLDTQNGSVLSLFSGNVQVAQILDRNRDGRADVVLVNHGR